MSGLILEKLSAFLEQSMNGLKLRPPLVDQPLPSLRIELKTGIGSSGARAKLRQLVDIYETLIEDGSRGFITAFSWPRDGSVPADDYLIEVFNRCLVAPELSAGVNYYGTEEPGEKIPYTQLVAETDLRRVDYANILRGIVNRELDVSGPVISWRVFFVSASQRVVIHPYDDRGVDIVAADESTLEPLK